MTWNHFKVEFPAIRVTFEKDILGHVTPVPRSASNPDCFNITDNKTCCRKYVQIIEFK